MSEYVQNMFLSHVFTARFISVMGRAPELSFEYAALWFYGLTDADWHGGRREETKRPHKLDDFMQAHSFPRRNSYVHSYPLSQWNVEETMAFYKALDGAGAWGYYKQRDLGPINTIDINFFVKAWDRLIEDRRKHLSNKRFLELCEWAEQTNFYLPKPVIVPKKTWLEKPASEKLSIAAQGTRVAAANVLFGIAVIIALAVMARIMYAGF